MVDRQAGHLAKITLHITQQQIESLELSAEQTSRRTDERGPSGRSEQGSSCSTNTMGKSHSMAPLSPASRREETSGQHHGRHSYARTHPLLR